MITHKYRIYTIRLLSAIDKLTSYNLYLLMAMFILFTQSCDNDNLHQETMPDNTSSRVVLAYMAGENDLSVDAKADLDEMLKGSTYMSSNDTLIVFYDNSDKKKLPCIYEITQKDKNKDLMDLPPVYTFEEDVNSASAATLDEVLQYLFSRYNADEYGLIFWSHGSGWVPSNYQSDNNNIKSNSCQQMPDRPIFESFGVDAGNNSTYTSQGYQMNISDMADVLKKYPKTKFIMFDACFMQSIEVAFELSEYTESIIASPAEIPAWGAPYQELTQPLFADTFNPNNVVDTYYSYYDSYHSNYGILLSVLDCKEFEAFTPIHNEMINKYQENFDNVDLSNTLNYFIFDKWNNPEYSSQYYQSDLPDYYDIRGVMRKVIADQSDYELWENQLNKLIRHSCMKETWYSGYPKSKSARSMPVDPEQFSGLTMYVEQDKYKNHYFYDAYKHIKWAKALGYEYQ